MANTELSHNIPQQIWQKFGTQLKNLGFKESDFAFVENYKAGDKNISEVPKIGQLGGSSGITGT